MLNINFEALFREVAHLLGRVHRDQRQVGLGLVARDEPHTLDFRLRFGASKCEKSRQQYYMREGDGYYSFHVQALSYPGS